MADSFRAQFVLSIKDELSAGLRKIINETKQLRDLAKQLGFKPLEGADAIVKKVDRDVSSLNRTLGGTAREAAAAAAAVRRLSDAELGQASAQANSLRRQAALARQATAAAGRGSGPTIAMGQSYASRPLLLAGPGRVDGVPAIAGRPSSRPLLLGRPGGSGGGGGSGGLTPYDAPFEERGPIPLNYRRPFGRMRDGMAGAGERLGALNEQVGAMGGLMAGLSLAEPIRSAAEFDNVLTHIAITAGATGDTVRDKVAAMAETYRAMALSVKQTSHDVAESAQFLITTGIGEAMTNELLPILAKAATAYNTPMRDAVQGAFSMHEELGIAPEDMRGALSAAALAAKQGHFSFADVSSFLPSVAAQAATAGITGREGLNVLLTALETSRRGAGTSGMAATNLQDFLSYIYAHIGTESFKKGGIDLPSLLVKAEKQGINPIEAVVERVRRLTAGMGKAQSANTIGKLFHNQEARIFVQTMLREMKYYQDTLKIISHASDMTIDEDFKKAQNLHTQLIELSEKSTQLNQRIGMGFSWVVPVGSGLLGAVLGSLQWMDKHLPGVGDGVIGLVGGMLGLVAVMGALGVVAGPVKAGFGMLKTLFKNVFSIGTFRLLVSPWLDLPLLIGAAVLDIWRHWERFRFQFTLLWRDLQQMAGGFGEFLEGAFIGDNDMAVRGLIRVWDGFVTSMRQMWGVNGIMEKLFADFGEFADQWTGGFATTLGVGIIKALDFVTNAFRQRITDWEALFNKFKPELPNVPFMVPPNLNAPDKLPRYPGPSGPELQIGKPGAGKPASYEGQDNKPQLIHITFEADVPGRASVRQGDTAAQARGPMLLRA